jgi:hypothetical protein
VEREKILRKGSKHVVAGVRAVGPVGLRLFSPPITDLWLRIHEDAAGKSSEKVHALHLACHPAQQVCKYMFRTRFQSAMFGLQHTLLIAYVTRCKSELRGPRKAAWKACCSAARWIRSPTLRKGVRSAHPAADNRLQAHHQF